MKTGLKFKCVRIQWMKGGVRPDNVTQPDSFDYTFESDEIRRTAMGYSPIQLFINGPTNGMYAVGATYDMHFRPGKPVELKP